MKCILFLTFLSIIHLYYTHNLSNSNFLNTNSNIVEHCPNPCLICQNTLYFLKFRGDAECRFTNCPGLCMSLTNKWNSGRDTHLTYFKQDQVNICEACFRSDLCHINDCLQEKQIVHEAIKHATEKSSFHYLNPNIAVFNMINKKSEDYFFNMDFIFKNLEKTIKLLNQYEKVYSDSNRLKKLYKVMLKFLSDKNKLSLSELNLGLDFDLDEEMLSKWKDINDHLGIYKNYYNNLKSKKIRLNEEQVYLSSDIKFHEESIQNIVDFDKKLKNSLDKAHNTTELYRVKCNGNVEKLNKMAVFVRIINSKQIGNLEKIKFITTDTNYTEAHIKDVLTVKNVPAKVENPIKISVAGTTIKINNDNNKPKEKKIADDDLDLFDLDEEALKKKLNSQNIATTNTQNTPIQLQEVAKTNTSINPIPNQIPTTINNLIPSTTLPIPQPPINLVKPMPNPTLPIQQPTNPIIPMPHPPVIPIQQPILPTVPTVPNVLSQPITNNLGNATPIHHHTKSIMHKKESEEDDMEMPDEDDEVEKAFLQKQSNKISELENNLSFFIASDLNLINKNRIKKRSLDEIKSSTLNFMDKMRNRLKKEKEIDPSINFIESAKDENVEGINSSSKNILKVMSNSLKNLDDEFFEIKQNILMNLLN